MDNMFEILTTCIDKDGNVVQESRTPGTFIENFYVLARGLDSLLAIYPTAVRIVVDIAIPQN